MTQTYDWEARRACKAFLALENGTVLPGYSVGAAVDREGEVVFNTGMTGYEEVLTDPSYAGQLVTMTYPEIGNYGFNREDMESRTMFLNGFIVHNMNEPSNFRSEASLPSVLKQYNIPAIAGIDTRYLTTILRSSGTLKGYLHCSDLEMSHEEGVAKAREWCGLDNQDYASKVSCTENMYGMRMTNSHSVLAGTSRCRRWNLMLSPTISGSSTTFCAGCVSMECG